MKKYFYYFLITFTICSCKKETKSLDTEITEPAKPVSNAVTTNIHPIAQPEFNHINIKGSQGMIISTEKYSYADTLQLYNADGKLLDEIINDDEKVVFAEPCYLKDSLSYTVLYNNQQAVVKKSDKLEFQTWEEHLVKGVSSVRFNPNINPLRQEPKKNSVELPYDKDEYYFPVQVKDNWLQVKWGDNNNWKYGWIKWKDDDFLVLELFYMC